MVKDGTCPGCDRFHLLVITRANILFISLLAGGGSAGGPLGAWSWAGRSYPVEMLRG
jgi:hypothetical protein